MLYVLLGLGTLFIGIGYSITPTNARMLLSGYNTLSKEKQDKVDLINFLSFFRKFHLVFGLSFSLIGLLIYFWWSEEASTYFLCVYPLLAYLYFIPRTARYWPEEQTPNGKIGVAVLLFSLVMVIGLMLYGSADSRISMEGSVLRTEGAYGEDIHADHVVEMGLVSSLPAIQFKSNGFAMGNLYKGYFKTKNGQTIKLILPNSTITPYVRIKKKNGKEIYFNSEEISSAQLIDSLKKSMPHVAFIPEN